MKRLVVGGLVLALVAAGTAVWPQTRAPSTIAGCVYNASLPTLSDKQTVVLQCDSSGRMLLH